MKRIFKRHISVTVVLVFFLVVPACAQRQSIRERIQQRRESKQESSDTSHDFAEKTSVETIKVNGTIRKYRLHLPAGYVPTRKYPLVICFHGLRSSARQQETLSDFSALADSEGFVAVYPEGLEAKWRFTEPNGDDVLFAEAIIAELTKNNSIDAGRIYANGISNGAQMVWRLVCDKPDLFAAVGFVSGGYPGIPGDPGPPAIIFHGTKDRLLPYEGRVIFMPVREFAQGWSGSRSKNGEIVLKKGEVEAEQWESKRSKSILYTISGKGHSWPGSSMPERITTRQVDATKEMWKFFEHVADSQL